MSYRSPPSSGYDSMQKVLDLDPADLRPEAVEAVVVAEQLLAVLELVGQAGGGRLVVLGLLAVPFLSFLLGHEDL